MDVIYQYDEKQNRAGATIPGVPLRDLTQRDLNRMAEWQRASVERAAFFHRTGAGVSIDVTEAARELADEHGVDLALVAGSGEAGRIVKSDVEAHIEEGEG